MLFTPDERELLLTTFIDHIYECETAQKDLINDLETELGDDEQDSQTIRDDIAQYTQRLGALEALLTRVTKEDSTGSIEVSRPDLDTIIGALEFYVMYNPQGSDAAKTLHAMEDKREVLNEQRNGIPDAPSDHKGA